MNAASKQVKKIGLFGYPSIISIITILIGSLILFFASLNDGTYLDGPYPDVTLIFLYVSAALFVLFLLIFTIWFSLYQLQKLKMPKLFLRTPNGSEYTTLISDV